MEVWKVNTLYGFQFAKMNADRVTESSFYIEGRRRDKNTQGVRVFDDFEIAKQYAIDHCNREIARLEEDLTKARDNLDFASSLQPETVPVAKSRW